MVMVMLMLMVDGWEDEDGEWVMVMVWEKWEPAKIAWAGFLEAIE